MASVNAASQDAPPRSEDTAPQMDIERVRELRREVLKAYADPVRTVLVFRLLRRKAHLTKEMLDEHTKNVMILVLKSIDVIEEWPPTAETDSQVERILEDYLDRFFSRTPEEEGVAELEQSQPHYEEGPRWSSQTPDEIIEVIAKAPEVDRTLYLLRLSFDLTYKELADIASRATGKQMSQQEVLNRIYQVQERIWNRLHKDDPSSKENS